MRKRLIVASTALALFAATATVQAEALDPGMKTRPFLDDYCRDVDQGCVAKMAEALAAGQVCNQHHPSYATEAPSVVTYLVRHHQFDTWPISRAAGAAAQEMYHCNM